MKISTRKTLLSLALALGSLALSAQSISGTVTHPCNNNGAINVTVSGMTPPISYTYSNWAANQYITHNGVNSLSDSHTGIGGYWMNWGNVNVWNVSAFDGVNYASQSFTLNPAFGLDSVKVYPATCPAQSTVEAININGGTSPYSCVWTNQNTNLSYNGNPKAVPDGIFTLVITDAAGCVLSTPTSSGSVWVQSTSPVSVLMSGSQANCTNGTATASPTGGTAPYSFLWSNNATSPTLSGLTAQWLTCIVTDAIGCSATGWHNVQQAVNINYNSTITQATCLQNNGGITSFVSGGTAPYTFLWSNSATTQNLTSVPGNTFYSVQITDANGCTGMGGGWVTSSTPINVTYNTTPSSCVSSTGGATLVATGGATPYSYIWYSWPSNSTGSSISNKPVGNYAFKVTDANGCIQTGQVVISPASTINASISNGAVICPATSGGLSTSVSGTSPPFTYAWSNLATTSAITGVPLGVYSCTITDATGCKVTKTSSVHQVVNMSIGLNSTGATCLHSANGHITANATGGTSPYSYSWSNSQTNATATNLLPGNYWVTATDANGCSKSAWGTVVNAATNSNCYCTITGMVFNDLNGNCVQNTGEAGIANIMIHVSGFGYAYTNSNGVYAIQVPTGTYTVSQTVQSFYPLSSCQSNNQVVNVTAGPNCVSTVNFGNTIVPVSDLHIITTNQNLPVPGSPYFQKIIVQNEGTMTEGTVKLGYTHDGNLSYGSSSPWSLIQQNSSSYPNWYSITSGFPSLNPTGSSFSSLIYNVPTNVPLGTVVNFKDTVAKAAPISTNWLSDYTPWNNVQHLQTTVVSSYDPNFKEVSPQGTGPQGNITVNDSVLTYVVHFQNEGTYFAQNVVVLDTIDSDLNIASLKPGYSSHNYRATVSENGVLNFTFANINLPWKSGYGDALSSGMFVYTIKQKKNLTVGTQIKNRAAIFFDYNEPIMTNQTLNTIAIKTSVMEISRMEGNDMLVYPNPAANSFNVVITSTRESKATLSLTDISGRTVCHKVFDLKAGENVLSENIELLQSGIYIVELKSDEVNLGKKLVISK